MIIPALLTHDLEQAKVKLHAIRDLSEWVQLDIMDGIFVPYKTLTIGQYQNLEIAQNIELHLMVQDPHDQFNEAQQICAKRILFHVEAVSDVQKMIQEMKKYSFEFGAVINPETEISALEPFIDYIEIIMVMGVHPGKSGQTFIPATIQKVKDIHQRYSDKILEVDGGVGAENIVDLQAAGINYFCVSSALFNADNVIEQYKKLNSLIV